MSTFLHIVCDGCGARDPGTKNAGQTIFIIRARLEKAGWATNNRNGVDHCPKCKEKRNAAKPKVKTTVEMARRKAIPRGLDQITGPVPQAPGLPVRRRFG